MNKHPDAPSAEVRQKTQHEEISRRAQELWRQYGCPQGRDEEIWLEADGQILGTENSSSAAPEQESIGDALTAGHPSDADAGLATPPGGTSPRDVELMRGTTAEEVALKGKRDKGAGR